VIFFKNKKEKNVKDLLLAGMHLALSFLHCYQSGGACD
jgi:hypothetical protein